MEIIKLRMWNSASNSYLYDIDNVFECLKQQHKFDGTMPDRGFVNAWDHKSEGMIWEMFSGLKDKNGIEVYSGDILLCKSATEPEDKGFLCVFENSAFRFKNVRFQNDGYYDIKLDEYNYISEYLEVIGNINENPELL